VITVIGTPLDDHLNPRFEVYQDLIDEDRSHLRDGQLLILRSTVYPGTTARMAKALEREGFDIDVAFCPERVAEGSRSRRSSPCRRSCRARSERAQRRAESSSAALTPTADPPGALGRRAGQALQQLLALHPVRDRESVLHDRERVRHRLLRGPPGDDREVSARQAGFPKRRFCRGPVPVQGHDAARVLQQQRAVPRPRGHAGQRRTAPLRGAARGAPAELSRDDRRRPRHGLQGRLGRCARFALLQAQEDPRARVPRGAVFSDPFLEDPTFVSFEEILTRATSCSSARRTRSTEPADFKRQDGRSTSGTSPRSESPSYEGPRHRLERLHLRLRVEELLAHGHTSSASTTSRSTAASRRATTRHPRYRLVEGRREGRGPAEGPGSPTATTSSRPRR
jgi:hypothetical protein